MKTMAKAGLTAGQKKLPEALQKKIMKAKKRKPNAYSQGWFVSANKEWYKKETQEEKFSTPGSRARAKADRIKKAILSQRRGEGGPKQKVVMRGFVKALYDKFKD